MDSDARVTSGSNSRCNLQGKSTICVNGFGHSGHFLVFWSFSCSYVVFYNENAICVGGFAMSKHELFDFHGKNYRFCYVFGELGVWLTRNI